VPAADQSAGATGRRVALARKPQSAKNRLQDGTHSALRALAREKFERYVGWSLSRLREKLLPKGSPRVVSDLVGAAVRLSGKEVLVRQGPIRRDCRFFDLALARPQRLGRAVSKYNSSLPVFGLQEFVALNNFMSGTRSKADDLGLDWPEASRILRRIVKEFGSGKGATAEQARDTERLAVQGKEHAGQPMGLADLPPRQQHLSQYFDNANLTPRQRECASLKWEYGLKDTQIAQRLDRHHSSVQERLSRARIRIDRAKAKERAAGTRARTHPGALD
jgi:hypothetical protein